MTTTGPAPGQDASKYLLPGEEAVINQRRHWAALARPTARTLPVLLVGLWVLTRAPGNRFTSTVGLLLVLAALVYLGLAVGEWWVRHFLVTKRRVLMTSGVIVRTVAVMPLRRITDLTYSESLVGQVLGYGGFRFESAGQDQALSKITYLPGAKVIYDQISSLLFPSDAAGARRGEEEDGGGPDPTDPPGRPTAHPATPDPATPDPATPDQAARPAGRPAARPAPAAHPAAPPATGPTVTRGPGHSTGPIPGFDNPYPHTPHPPADDGGMGQADR